MDVIIVGSGQAGVPLAVRLAGAGRRVALVERARLGGTCVNYGCTPSKTMIASAHAAHVARTAAALGVHCGEVRVDLPAVVARKEKIVDEWREGVAARIAQAGPRLRLVRGTARFVGARELEVGGERLRGETVILNVGARPSVPKLPGLDRVPWLDNQRAMELRELPRRLLVVGGGYIGCELGQMFRRFGAEVTIVDRAPHLLAREDPEISESLEGVFRDEGIALELGVELAGVELRGGEIVLRAGDRELTGSHLLIATGRHPNTDDLDCEAGGVERDQRGYVIVDDYYRTSAMGVFAVGDVTGPPQFTHTSWDDHRLLFELLLGRGSRSRTDRLIPYAVFTDPEVGRIGLSESEARQAGVRYEVATLPFSAVARARETGRTAGVMKLLLDPETERVLGVALVGAEAAELVHIFVPLMQAGASARAIVDPEFVHPTFAEGVQSLVMRLPRYALD
jgi:pyruvate/2-oxoglutarate dehydrogenase complex dihydrolipoamide dehydrogenase (E3) component